MGAEHLGELAVEIDELLGDLLAFRGVGVQKLRPGGPAQDSASFHPRFQVSFMDTFMP